MNINLEKSKLEPSFDDFIKRYQKEDIEILDLRDKIFEDKRKKIVEKKNNFQRLSKKRLNNLLKNINLLSNLSNTSYYSFNEEDSKILTSKLKKEMKKVFKNYNIGLCR